MSLENPSFATDYQVTTQHQLTHLLINLITADIAQRIRALDGKADDWDDLIEQGVSAAVQTIQDTIAPQLAAEQAKLTDLTDAMDLAEDQLLLLQQGGILASNVLVSEGNGVDATTVDAALSELAGEITQSASDLATELATKASGDGFAALVDVVAQKANQTSLSDLSDQVSDIEDQLGTGIPVGSAIPWFSDIPPSAIYMRPDGAAYSRTTYADLHDAHNPERTVVITSGSAVVTGIGSDNGLVAGLDIEGAGIPAATTILSVDSASQITLSANAISNGTTCRVFPFGNGDGSTTANLPNFMGLSLRQWDPTGIINPDEAAMLLMQNDAMQQITGSAILRGAVTFADDAGEGSITTGRNSAASTANDVANGTTDYKDTFDFDSAKSPDARTSTETRGKSFIVNYMIKVAGGVDDPSILTASSALADIADAVAKADAVDAKVDALPILASATAVESTSGTAIDFTNIPASVTKLTVEFFDVELSGGNQILVQIGDAGGLDSTGYEAVGGVVRNGSYYITAVTDGFIFRRANVEPFSGVMTITRVDGDKWVAAYSGCSYPSVVSTGGGKKELSGELTQLRITPSASDTFTAGFINIKYE